MPDQDALPEELLRPDKTVMNPNRGETVMKRSKTTLWLMLACGVLFSGQVQADCPAGCTNCFDYNQISALRTAISSANDNDVICLTNSQYGYEFDGDAGGDNAGNALPKPSADPLTIEGRPGATLTRDSGDNFRLIHIDKTKLILENLQIAGFSAAGISDKGNDGGAIYSDNGKVTIQNSTLTGNSATTGGAIYSDNGKVTIQNSTLTGNSATKGRAIHSDNGEVTIENSTLSDDNAIDIDSGNGGSGTVTSSILMGSTLCNGNVSSGGNNLMSSSSRDKCGFDANEDLCCNGSSPCSGSCGVSETLLRNGGPTQTLALLYDSPAMGNGNCGDNQEITDQRDVLRYHATTGEDSCDIGAYETMCSVDENANNVLDINIYMDFENPGEKGAFPVMNSSACQISSIPAGTTEIHWNVFPFNEAAKESQNQKMQAFNIYHHTKCYASGARTGCTSLVAGKQPVSNCDGCKPCDSCINPCIFEGADHSSKGEIDATAIGPEGKLFYKIVRVNTDKVEEERQLDDPTCPPDLSPTPSCDQEPLPACTPVGHGDSWWYTIQWSQTVNEGSWDPLMECKI